MKPRAACIYVDSARRYVEPAEEKKGVDRNWLSLREGHRHRKASHIQCMRTFTCCVRAAFIHRSWMPRGELCTRLLLLFQHATCIWELLDLLTAWKRSWKRYQHSYYLMRKQAVATAIVILLGYKKWMRIFDSFVATATVLHCLEYETNSNSHPSS